MDGIGDSIHRIADSSHRFHDLMRGFGDSTHRISNSIHRIADSMRRIRDSMHRFTDSSRCFGDLIRVFSDSDLPIYQTEAQKEPNMAKFPEERAKVIELAHDMMNGMADHPGAFTDSPVSVAQIMTALGGLTTSGAVRQSAQSALDDAIADDQAALKHLIDFIQLVINFARGKRKTVPDILKWIHFEDAEPNELPPGLCRSFELVKRTPSLLTLDWKGPKVGTDAGASEGGKARLFEVVWRLNAAQEWQVAATVLVSDAQISLTQWSAGTTLEIGVRAVNKQGPGPVSPTITIAL